MDCGWVHFQQIFIFGELFHYQRMNQFCHSDLLYILQAHKLSCNCVFACQRNWLWSLLPKNVLAVIRSSSYLHTACKRFKSWTHTRSECRAGIMQSTWGTKWFFFNPSLLSDLKRFRAWVRNEKAFMLKSGLIKKGRTKTWKLLLRWMPGTQSTAT